MCSWIQFLPKFYNEKESCQSLGGTFIAAKFHKAYIGYINCDNSSLWQWTTFKIILVGKLKFTKENSSTTKKLWLCLEKQQFGDEYYL